MWLKNVARWQFYILWEFSEFVGCLGTKYSLVVGGREDWKEWGPERRARPFVGRNRFESKVSSWFYQKRHRLVWEVALGKGSEKRFLNPRGKIAAGVASLNSNSLAGWQNIGGGALGAFKNLLRARQRKILSRHLIYALVGRAKHLWSHIVIRLLSNYCL